MEITKRQLQDEEVTAYHGGPHTFDKFSTQYIGTGEGNQSFGWGLYFTDLEDIAKGYANTLAKTKRKQSGVKYPRPEYIGVDFLNVISKKIIPSENEFMLILEKEKNRVSKEIKKTDNIEYELTLTEYLGSLNKIKSLSDALDKNKYFYKVTIHKGKTPEQYTWLEWDKPLTDNQKKLIIDQSRKENLKPIKKISFGLEDWTITPESIITSFSPKSLGMEIYRNISAYFNSDKEASLFLLRAGIDGIKYPTGTLSSALNNTRGFNYVVFDENAVSIEKQTQLEGMEVTKAELEEAKKERTKLRKKKKADRCLRIARSKMPQTSAYRSGNIVRCRQGKIWKGLKEEDENFGSDDINLSGHKNYTDWVIIHRNLNKPPYWSIKQSNGSKKIGKVIGYDTSILLKDVKFIVLKSGQERARSEQTKNVHGGAVGKIVDSGGNYNTNGWTLVTYNPFIDDTFIEKETGEPIYTAKEAVLKNTKEIWVKKEDDSLNEKTDFSKEKEQGLHGWFARQGGKGKSKGWVDCNTCRDGKCKSCGRKEGEKRSKYPACRPTPSACKTKGKGKSWGKKNEEFPIQSLYREKENMEIKKKDIFDEDLVLKRSPSDKKIYVQSDLSDESARKKETFKNKEALKGAGFAWDGKNSAWNINDVNFMLAKKTIETINKKEYIINQLEELEEIVFNTENFEGKNNLMDRIDLYINDLANATDEVAVSAEIRKYLTFFSKFRTYSLHNSMLIYIQSGGKATKVRTSPQWYNDFHRKIKAGAKAIWIYRPLNQNKSKNDDESGEEITKQNVTRFVPFPTFDIADTEAIDKRGEVPEEPNWFADLEPTERSIELYKYFIELCEDMGIQITKSGSERGEKGYSAGNKINISSAREGAGEVSTLVHEIAHELMHWKKSSIYYQENTSGELRELQAESVSYVVLKHYELPTEHHPTYLALWKANKDKIKANLKVISSVASFIISEIDRIEKRHQKNEVINEQVFKDVKNIFKRFMKKL
jgi:hypothetical protein